VRRYRQHSFRYHPVFPRSAVPVHVVINRTPSNTVRVEAP
jgi:hypothetical protein